VTPCAPSTVCLLFIALHINKEKDNANSVLSFITQSSALEPHMCVIITWKKLEDPSLIKRVQKAQILGSLKKHQAGIVHILEVLSEFLGDIKKSL